jgi:c-di-GMP-binding flagellar brake protein YcgR
MEAREKRKKVRVPFRTEIIIEYEDRKIRFEGDSVNISMGGMLVETEEGIPLGTTCRTRLRLTGTQEPIELTMDGRVVREDASGFGIQFDEMDLDSYTLLKEVIRHNTDDPDNI